MALVPFSVRGEPVEPLLRNCAFDLVLGFCASFGGAQDERWLRGFSNVPLVIRSSLTPKVAGELF